MNISKIIGLRYDSLEEAKKFVKAGQLVVTENDETYYILEQETFNQKLHWTNYKAI